MKRKYVNVPLLIAMLGFLGIGAWVFDAIHASPEENQAIYDVAREACPTEIWLIYNDIGPTIPQEPQLRPYPTRVTDITGKSIYGYACSESEAHDNAKIINF